MWNIQLGFFLIAIKKNPLQERSIEMEVLNLILFGCVFYLAFIGIPTLCEKRR